MGRKKFARRLLTCGLIGLALAGRSRAEVVVLSADRQTVTHSHVTYLPGKQPAGTKADQLIETTTVAPDLSPFQTATQTSAIGANPGGGGMKLTANATGSLLTQPANGVYSLWESWTYNRTAVTFDVVDQAEQFSFHIDNARDAIANLTGIPAPLVYSGDESDTTSRDATGTLQPGVYTFYIDLLTYDSADILAPLYPTSPLSMSGQYANVTFSVTPEPASLAIVVLALAAGAARPKRRADPAR